MPNEAQTTGMRPLDTTGALITVDGHVFLTKQARFSAAGWPPVEGATPGYIEVQVTLERDHPASVWSERLHRSVVLMLPSGPAATGADLEMVLVERRDGMITARFEGFVGYAY